MLFPYPKPLWQPGSTSAQGSIRLPFHPSSRCPSSELPAPPPLHWVQRCPSPLPQSSEYLPAPGSAGSGDSSWMNEGLIVYITTDGESATQNVSPGPRGSPAPSSSSSANSPRPAPPPLASPGHLTRVRATPLIWNLIFHPEERGRVSEVGGCVAGYVTSPKVPLCPSSPGRGWGWGLRGSVQWAFALPGPA